MQPWHAPGCLVSYDDRVKQWRQREFKVGGTSLVSRLSACLTEANWWRLIAEWNRLEAERRATNIGLLYPKVRNNIGGGYSCWRPPNQNIGGMCPRRGWRQCLLIGRCKQSLASLMWTGRQSCTVTPRTANLSPFHVTQPYTSSNQREAMTNNLVVCNTCFHKWQH